MDAFYVMASEKKKTSIKYKKITDFSSGRKSESNLTAIHLRGEVS